MMLTALNASTGSVLDVTLLDPEALAAQHGRRQRKRHGIELICRQCEGGVHPVLGRGGRVFYRHDPGEGRGCLLREIARVSSGESEEHLEAKFVIARRKRKLGWNVEPEQRFDRDGDVVIVDLFAEHPKARPHQRPTAWEVQLSHETRGGIHERSEQRRRIAGCRTVWVTPHDEALGAELGFVTSPSLRHVVARMYTGPDEQQQLPPMPLGEVVAAINRKHPRLLLAQSGEPLPGTFERTWIICPTGTTSKAHPHRVRPVERDDAIDTGCNRAAAAPLQVQSPPLDLTALVLDLDICGRCGARIDGAPWGFTFDPPMHKDCFQTTQREKYAQLLDVTVGSA